MGMKEFLPESDFVYGLRTVVTQVRNFDTCLYISENKCTYPKNNVWYIFFFNSLSIKFPTPSFPLDGRSDIFPYRNYKNAFTKILK